MSYIRYDDTDLDEDSLRKAKAEIGEDEVNVEEYLDNLKKLLVAKKDLNPCLSEKFLLGYLRVTKFNLNKACERIFRYYQERANTPHIFGNYLPSNAKLADTARKFYALPYRTRDNSAVILIKRAYYDPSKVSYETIVRGVMMIIDALQFHPVYQLTGFHFIFDLSSSHWSSWNDYTPSRIKLLSRLVQRTVSLRIRGAHVINAPTIFYILYSMFHPLLSDKIKNRVCVHKSVESLHAHIDPECLPKEYGGPHEESDLINLFERMYKMEDFFELYSKYGYLEKKY